MEAVGDLPRLRRAFMCALGEGTAAIAADDLDVRMLLEPVRCRARRTIRQKVDHLTPLQVDDDGPISGTLSPRPIVNAHHSHARFGAARLCLTFEAAQDRIVAGRHADPPHQPFTSPAADAVAEEMDEFGRPTGAARQRRGDPRQLLGEGLPLASFETTLPSLDTKLHDHARALCRQILQMALMPAMPVQ